MMQNITTMSLFHTQGSLSQEVAGPSRLADLQVPPPPLKRERGSRTSALEEAAIRFFWRATEVLGAPHTRQENIAAFIAYKMQRMEEGQKAMCEALISEALEKGMRGQITPHTQLWDGPPPPPSPPGPTPPPATSPTAQPQPGRKCERKTVRTLDPVWSAKKCSLLSYHSLGTLMSSAAIQVSVNPGPDCPPLHMDSSGHQF
ncbi:hypothetical protein AB205_0076150 [Aquarana catesbeiana]|uniref:Uncharacterized protein n=1 Tax=Aquarana catesbeiana TaxID=8400 RepID=A0A2G9Q2B0_AQUCT|nr:hypothetical protein AB205_0076150 [Aquarana catesbeiana]